MAVLRELVPTFLSQISHNAPRTNRKLETLDTCILYPFLTSEIGSELIHISQSLVKNKITNSNEYNYFHMYFIINIC